MVVVVLAVVKLSLPIGAVVDLISISVLSSL